MDINSPPYGSLLLGDDPLLVLLHSSEELRTRLCGSTTFHRLLRREARNLSSVTPSHLWARESTGEVWLSLEPRPGAYFSRAHDLEERFRLVPGVQSVCIRLECDPEGEGWVFLGACGTPPSKTAAGIVIPFEAPSRGGL